MPAEDSDGTYLTLFKNRNFTRLFAAQAVSSLGDWVGVIAIAVFAQRLGGNAAVGAVMTARVLPGFVAGPIAGVIADRWDRRKTMVAADLARALIVFSLPFFPNLLYLLLASMALESMTLTWGPAKDASLPHVVPAKELTRANSLNLLAVYGPWPLASIVFASMNQLGSLLGDKVPALSGLTGNEEALALWVNSLTFVFSAAMIWSLSLPHSRRREGRLQLGDVWQDLVEGLRFVRDDRRVRPWLLGIAFTFTAAGGVFSLGVGFVEDVLGGGGTGFAFLIGFLGIGMIVGLLSVGALARRIAKDVMFSASLILLGGFLIALASMTSLDSAIPIAAALGFFGGAAYSTGYSLIHETVEDELRGRTFSAAYTVIRIGTLVGLGFFPFIASAIGDNVVDIPGAIGRVDLPGSRVTLWLAGLVAAGGGLLSMRAIGHERAQAERKERARSGLFVAFEGGEGAGKTTQMAAFVDWLRARGVDVVVTREPGGTPVGHRIRELLLEPAVKLDARAEALLYAADRAQHAAEVIRPALDRGRVVVSDRFVDSSLAYQGAARDLGVDSVLRISNWATGGIIPDIVFLLQITPAAGLERAEGERDRIELEDANFHDRVSQAYLELATRFPERFVVIDASQSKSDVHRDIVRAYEDRASHTIPPAAAVRDLGAPGPPVPR
ncbi:MAG TPA: dTMP kinase [Actinomycetota bacterium]|nr:dTMP kinase [Actinomycetota bacterium]